MRRLELINELSSRISEVFRDHPVRVAIDGVDASGKTMLADELVVPRQRMGRSVIRASIDGFHNPATIRRRRGATSAEGYYYDSFNYTDLIKELLVPLGPGGSLRYRRAVFDFRTDSPLNASVEEAQFDAVLLFDGVFLLRPELCQYWDFSIFVHADFQVTVRRAEVRDLGLFGSATTVRSRYQQS